MTARQGEQTHSVNFLILIFLKGLFIMKPIEIAFSSVVLGLIAFAVFGGFCDLLTSKESASILCVGAVLSVLPQLSKRHLIK